MKDPLDAIEDACHFALRMMMKPSTRITGCLNSENGCYLFADGATLYHPLEAVLYNEDVMTSDWKADVATVLHVDAAWVEGFMDGFAQTGERSNDQDYIQGFLVGEIIRGRRRRMLQE